MSNEAPISQNSIDLVQTSFQKVIPIADIAVGIFYDNLFEISPEARALFPTDKDKMTGQKNKLRDMLVVSVNGLSNLDKLVPMLQSLGKRHIGYKVEKEHYDMVGSALIGALATGLGDDFTPEVKQAWVEVYTLMANTMIEASYS